MECPFCGKGTGMERNKEDGIVVYRCTRCDSILKAFEEEHEDRLKDIFSKYDFTDYNPSTPEWIGATDHGKKEGKRS